MGIAVIVTAVATGIVAILEIYKARKNKMLPIVPIVSQTDGEYYWLDVDIYPSTYMRSIRKISSNAQGIAWASSGTIDQLKHKKYLKSLPIYLDILPASVSKKPVTLHLAFKLRKSQKSVIISLYKSFRLFAVRCKVNVNRSVNADCSITQTT